MINTLRKYAGFSPLLLSLAAGASHRTGSGFWLNSGELKKNYSVAMIICGNLFTKAGN